MKPPLLIHLTTTDMSLELLLGPQLSAFAEAGYDVAGASAPGDFVADLTARGIRHIPLKNATRAMDLRRDAAALAELARLFRAERPQIVHTHNPKPGVYGRLAAKAARVPVIVNTVHGLYAQPGDPLGRRSAVYGLERLAAFASDAELVQNPEDIPTLRRLGIRANKVSLLGNGVDLERFKPATAAQRAEIRAELDLAPDRVVVGAVGRLVAEKGYPELFEAWEVVSRQHHDATLVVVGPDDPDKPDALDRDIVARAEAAGVRFLGMRHDIERLYGAFDLYVLASHREGYPRSAMEAAAGALPVVATDIRGCRQVVDDGVTGVLSPPRSPWPLAVALGSVIGDRRKRAAMSAAARRRAERHFDQQQVIDTTLATYRRLGAPPTR